MNWQWASVSSINAIDKSEFAQLACTGNKSSPFLTRDFLEAMESSGSVGEAQAHTSGWKVFHIVVKDESNVIIAFLPAYIKSHSYGEYVFDHSWAHAYGQHGLLYYPKLVIGVPFTPVTGPRILVKANANIDTSSIIQYLSTIADELMLTHHLSSIHWLFPEQPSSKQLQNVGFHQRQSVQFNWHNKGFKHFDDYLSQLTARRRRSIKKERKSIKKQGVSLLRLTGDKIEESHMQFFYQCYQQTYLKRSGHTGYLSAQFFDSIYQTMGDKMLLVIAQQGEEFIASALFFYDQDGLYGRYWGSRDEQEVSGLHFEACYYQGIEFCIEHNINFFNPGTQGEHKILRGFEPTICYSNHKMLHKDFDKAVADFVNKEQAQIESYAKNASTLLPFKN